MKSQSTLGHITRPADTLAMPSPVPEKLVFAGMFFIGGALQRSREITEAWCSRKNQPFLWSAPWCLRHVSSQEGNPLLPHLLLALDGTPTKRKCRFEYLYVCLYIYMDVSICICLSVKLLPSCLAAYSSIDLSMNLYVYLFINLSDLST